MNTACHTNNEDGEVGVPIVGTIRPPQAMMKNEPRRYTTIGKVLFVHLFANHTILRVLMKILMLNPVNKIQRKLINPLLYE